MAKKTSKKLKKSLRVAETRSLENPNIPLSAAAIVQYLGGGMATLAGVDVAPGNAERMLAVWRAVNLTASTVAGMPLKCWRDRPSGAREEIDPPLFVDPMYPEITWFEGIETAVRHMLLWGNAYLLLIRNEAGDAIVRLLPVKPETVDVYRDSPSALNPSGKWFKVEGIEEPMPPSELLHLPWISHDGIEGISPIGVARQAIGAAIAAEEVGAKMFDSGLLAGGVLKASGVLNDEQAEQVKRRWMEKVRGQVRAYEVAVLSEGFDFQQATIPPQDAQWIESRKFGVEEIARLYGCPPALLFEYGGTGNVEADKLGAQWLRFGLNQVLLRVEKRLSMALLPRGSFCEFVREGLLQGTPLDEIEALARQIECGLLTVDEAREIKDRPPLPKEEKPEPKPEPVEEEEDGSGDEGISDSADDAAEEPGE